MSDGPWHCRHQVAIDGAIAVFFAALGTGATLAGNSWWPAHPGTLAWVMLGLQSVASLSLVARRRAALTVVGILTAFTLAVTLLIWSAGCTAYRVVREALTNAAKHAPGARVVVRVEYDESQVRVTIRNTPPTGQAASALGGTGSGLGIANLRQRIELVHGTLRAARSPDGGFCVQAALPAYVPTAASAV